MISEQPQPQLQLVQSEQKPEPEKPKRPRRPPKDPGENRPGDRGVLHARLRDFGFRVPSELRRQPPKVQKAVPVGDKKNERVERPQSAAAGDVIMSEQAQGQAAPAAGGGINVEKLAEKAVEGVLGDAGGLMKGAQAYMDAQAGKVIRWGRVKETGVIIGGATLLAAVLVLTHAAVNRQGIFTPKPAAPAL